MAQPGKLTKRAEQAFLLALSATCNVRLSAAAAGAAEAAFYRRRRKSQAFAREWELALQIGYDRLECAMMEQACAAAEGGGADSQWRDRAGETPLPPMSIDQAFQLFAMHRRTCRLGWEHRLRRQDVGSYDELAGAVHGLIAQVGRGRHYEETGGWRMPGEEAAPELPPLDQVTGWSKADPDKAPHHAGVALFGGWRIADMKRVSRLRSK